MRDLKDFHMGDVPTNAEKKHGKPIIYHHMGLSEYTKITIQGGAPPVISWFIIPLTIDISTISPSY